MFFLLGGEKKSEVVSSSATSFTITDLPASSAYKIQVSAVVRSKEGSPVMVTARTCESLLIFQPACLHVNVHIISI